MDFNKEKQRLLLEFLVRDNDSFTKCLKIIRPEYFDENYKRVVAFLIDYINKYHSLPSPEIIYANFPSLEKIELDEKTILTQKEYFINQLEKFCQTKALYKAILESSDKIEKGIFEGIEQSIKEALSVRLDFDLGLNYFESPTNRIKKLLDNNNTISTGWRTVDKKLYGGLNRGEITIFAGNSGEGKSLFLQNITVNWLLGPEVCKNLKKGLNIIYYTLELSDLLVSSRIDAMILGRSTKENFRNAEEVEIYLNNLRKKKPVGTLLIKKMVPGITINDLRAHLKEYEIQNGYKPDAIIIDYLDLMYPTNKKINPGDLFVKDKFVSEEVRGLASSENVLCVTASQLNRSAVEAEEHEMNHISGGISKVNTADNVITIKRMVREEKYKIKFIKTRSSSGVGQELQLAYNPLSMRITDLEVEEDEEEFIDVIKSKFKKPSVIEKEKLIKDNDSDYKKELKEKDDNTSDEIENEEEKIESINLYKKEEIHIEEHDIEEHDIEEHDIEEHDTQTLFQKLEEENNLKLIKPENKENSQKRKTKLINILDNDKISFRKLLNEELNFIKGNY